MFFNLKVVFFNFSSNFNFSSRHFVALRRENNEFKILNNEVFCNFYFFDIMKFTFYSDHFWNIFKFFFSLILDIFFNGKLRLWSFPRPPNNFKQHVSKQNLAEKSSILRNQAKHVKVFQVFPVEKFGSKISIR